ncbi:MAG TPA: hypothetical protein VJG65_01215 [Patescibacteria group bacterium]|nr:hypothetical protein [Patescibacteria group bacterium]
MQVTQRMLKREEKLQAQKENVRKQKYRRWLKSFTILVVISGLIGFAIWYLATSPSLPESDIMARQGIHWHPELTIYLKEVEQEIPMNIGIGVVHKPIHTHDNTGIIHLEFPSVVRKRDITLDQFFNNWGKNFSDFGVMAKMTVNGKENNELENYVMNNGDKIELWYE